MNYFFKGDEFFMFFKNLKNYSLFFLLSLFIIPINILAYSDYIIASGQNIGIEINSNGILIVGTYEIDGISPASIAKLKNGDKIIKINDQKVTTIKEMINQIETAKDKENIKITYLRATQEENTILKLIKDKQDIYKTGLYVKDSVTGIGTLTYIDPNTKIYGALGHEIIEKNTGQKLEIKNGKIYESKVTSITRSSLGNPGEKNAKYDNTKIYGDVFENTKSGIFGNYQKEIDNQNLYKVASKEDIKIGKAKLLTVIDQDTVTAFDISILKISDDNQKMKNILFEITDPNLLAKTGGIVQGMSGSPIIQDNYIIGAVTHVIIDNPKQGYGIFITKMLEEGEN